MLFYRKEARFSERIDPHKGAILCTPKFVTSDKTITHPECVSGLYLCPSVIFFQEKIVTQVMIYVKTQKTLAFSAFCFKIMHKTNYFTVEIRCLLQNTPGTAHGSVTISTELILISSFGRVTSTPSATVSLSPTAAPVIASSTSKPSVSCPNTVSCCA